MHQRAANQSWNLIETLFNQKIKHAFPSIKEKICHPVADATPALSPPRLEISVTEPPGSPPSLYPSLGEVKPCTPPHQQRQRERMLTIHLRFQWGSSTPYGRPPIVATTNGTRCFQCNLPPRRGMMCPLPRRRPRWMMCPHPPRRRRWMLRRRVRVLPPPWERGAPVRAGEVRERAGSDGCFPKGKRSDRAGPD